MNGLKVGAAAVAAMMLASGCETYFDHDSVTVLEAHEENFWQNGDELVLATIDFRVKPGVAGSAEAVFNPSSLANIAEGLRDGQVRQLPNSQGLYVFEDLEVASFQSLLAGEAPEVVGQVVIGFEDDGTPHFALEGALNDVASDLEDVLADVLETRPVTDLLANPEALMDDLADAAAVLQPETTFFEDLLLKIISFGNDDDVLGFNILVFVPVVPDLAPLVDGAFANLPDGFYGGAFPTEYNGETIPAKRFELLFDNGQSAFLVETFVGGGTAGGADGVVFD